MAEQQGPLDIARDVRKRLSTIARSGSFLDDRRRDELLRELDRQRQAITGPIGDHSPDLAVQLLRDVLELAEGLCDRCDDGGDPGLNQGELRF